MMSPEYTDTGDYEENYTEAGRFLEKSPCFRYAFMIESFCLLRAVLWLERNFTKNVLEGRRKYTHGCITGNNSGIQKE